MEARHRANVTPIEDIVQFLDELFVPQLVAYMAPPGPERGPNLRAAYHTAILLLDYEAADTVRAFFVGMNPDLDDKTPAECIRAGRHEDVLNAATAMIAG